MKISMPVALLSLAVGFCIGFAVNRSAGRPAALEGDANATGTAPHATGSSGAASGADRLARLESEVDRLTAELEKLRTSGKTAGPGSLAPGARSAPGPLTIAESRDRIAALLKVSDAEELLRLVKTLCLQGEEGCEVAWVAVAAMYEAIIMTDAQGWGVDGSRLKHALFSGAMLPLLEWAIRHPEKSDEWFRHEAAENLDGIPGLDFDFVREMLHKEQDPLVAASLVDAILGVGNDRRGADLAAAVRARGNEPEVGAAILEQLWGRWSPEIDEAVRELAGSPLPDVRKAAELALLAWKPPPGTAFVRYVSSRNQKTQLKAGDLILTVEGVPNLKDLDAKVQAAPEGTVFEARVRRGEEELTLAIPGGTELSLKTDHPIELPVR